MTERLKRLALPLLILLILLVVADRVAWGSVARWREDEATDLWLGYTRGPLQVPVGLMTSTALPGPNGLVLLSELLSRLPNPWYVSAVLGALQAGLLFWVCWLLVRDRKLLALVLGPLLSSILLRSISVELAQTWMLTLVNLLFFGGILLYLRRGTAWSLPLAVAAVFLAPSIYIAGGVNVLAYAVVVLIIVITRPPAGPVRRWIAPAFVSLALASLSIWLTWAPYFQAVGLAGIGQAGSYSGLALPARLKAAAETLIAAPYWSVAQVARFGTGGGMPPLQTDPHVLSPRVYGLYEWTQRLAMIQGWLCYLAIVLAIVLLLVRRQPLRELFQVQSRGLAYGVGLVVVFVLASYVFAPLVGGPVWGQGQRLDETIQFVPFLMIAWFLLPPLLSLPSPLARVVLSATVVLSIAFTSLSALTGWAVIRSNLRYHGRVFPPDVPLVDKLAVVDFIAHDWRDQSSSNLVPVAYDVADVRWDWIPAFGTNYLPWYPAPYTLGRHFDFLLLREYGLTNTQEGIQFRGLEARYVVSYAYAARPTLASANVEDYIFGRLRVTVVKDWKAGP